MNIPNEINGFKLYENKPHSISSGFLYTKSFYIPSLLVEKERTIRVYLPEDYFLNNKSYSVMYFFDGQNMVDKYTTAYGEWNLDETISTLNKEKNKSLILVGIDSPRCEAKYRSVELAPEGYMPIKKYNEEFLELSPIGSVLGEFIFNELKPIIDNTFRVYKDKKHTGVGGSSMGGLESFFLSIKYKNYIGFSLIFSPAFFLYSSYSIKKNMKLIKNDKDLGKMFFFVGGQGFEQLFIKSTYMVYDYLYHLSKDKEKFKMVFDSSKTHCESSWEYYSYIALDYLL
ncbi:MAG: alpha/beta hydrolase [Bacilli bacterium]